MSTKIYLLGICCYGNCIQLVNMAATPELDDPLLDLIGQSLFDVIEEKNRTLNKVCDCTCDAKPDGVIL